MSKKAHIWVIIYCIFLILTGIIIVNNSMPEFVKKNSGLSIDYRFSPFDVKLETKNYCIDMNGNIFYDFKKSSEDILINIDNNIKGGLDNRVKGLGKIFNQIKDNINH